MLDLDIPELDSDPIARIERRLNRDPLGMGSPRRKRKVSDIPDLTPESESSILASLGEGAISGITYLGQTLDKITGSRALRGILGGKPRELLSMIPFSDAIGDATESALGVRLGTDRNDIVHGTDLIGAPRDTPLFSPEGLLGFGLEVGLDPTLPFTGFFKGAATAGGKGLKAAGLYDKAIQATVKTASKAGEKIGPRVAAMRGTGRAFLDALEPAARTAAEESIKRANKGAMLSDDLLDMPLAGNLGYGIPFMDTVGTIGKAGGVGESIAKVQDTVGDFLRNANIPGTEYAPGRHLARLFEPSSKSIGSANMQKGAQEAYAAELPLKASMTEPIYNVVQEMKKFGPTPDELDELAMMKLDPAASDPAAILAFENELNAKRYNPREFRDFMEIRPPANPLSPQKIDAYTRWQKIIMDPQNESFLRAQKMGAAGEEFADPYIYRYAPRATEMESAAKNADFSAPQKFGDAPASKDHRVLNTQYGARIARGDHMRGWAEGSNTIERVLDDPDIINALTHDDTFAVLTSKYASLFPEHTAALANGETELYDGLVKTIEGFKKSTKPEVVNGVVKRKEFWKDPIMAAYEKGLGRARGESHTQGIMSGLVETAKQQRQAAQKAGYQAPAESRPLGEVLKSAKLLQGDETKGAVKFIADELGIAPFDRAAARQAAHQAANAQGLAAGSDARKAFVESQTNAAFQAWKSQVNDLPVPKGVWKDVERAQKLFDSPEEVSDIVKAVDSFNAIFKAGVLTAPAFHVRNLTGAKVMDALMGEFSLWSNHVAKQFIEGKQIDALKYPHIRDLLAKRGLPATQENANQAFRAMLASIGIHSPHSGVQAQIASTGGGKSAKTLADLAAEIPGTKPMGLGLPGLGGFKPIKEAWDSGTRNPLDIRGVMDSKGVVRDATGFAPLKVNEAFGAYIDAMTRLPPLLNQLARGVDLHEALGKVLASQVDYAKRAYTPFENGVMKRWIPFYSFTRKMGEHVFKELADKPSGRLAQVVRGQGRAREDEQFVPSHIAQGTAMPIPGGPEGFQRYLTSLGLMHEDPLNMLRPGQNAYKTVSGTLQELAGRLNPLAKAPLELAAGKQLFSGRDLEDLEGNLGRIGANLTGADEAYDTPLLAEQLLANSPASRLATTVRTLTDRRKGPLAKGVNLLSGVRTTDVDIEKSRNIAKREAIEDTLKGKMGVRTLRPHLYVREEDMDKMSDRDVQVLQIYKSLAKESQKKAREQKKLKAF